MKSQASLLQGLIKQGEHQQQDFKFKIDDAQKLARSVSAFANTDGGRLLIGVRDDGSIHGVRSEEEIFMMHAAAYKYCTPAPTIKFETLHVPTSPMGGKLRTVVICTVEPSAMRPVFALEETGTGSATEEGDPQHHQRQRTAFIRVADENIVASPIHLAIWRQQQRLQGEAYADTPEERALLNAIETHAEGLTLNQLLRTVSPSSMRRQAAIETLARFVRFNLAQLIRLNNTWVICPST